MVLSTLSRTTWKLSMPWRSMKTVVLSLHHLHPTSCVKPVENSSSSRLHLHSTSKVIKPSTNATFVVKSLRTKKVPKPRNVFGDTRKVARTSKREKWLLKNGARTVDRNSQTKRSWVSMSANVVIKSAPSAIGCSRPTLHFLVTNAQSLNCHLFPNSTLSQSCQFQKNPKLSFIQPHINHNPCLMF